jgi:predicted O-methyltransferase YrrM
MDLDEIRRKIEGIPHMELAQARTITAFIHKNRIKNILELGFSQGVSTCFMAGALDKLGRGSITTIDLEYTRNVTPNIEELLRSLGLLKYVIVYYEQTSYIWRLMKLIEEDSAPRFDFCYIDGAHSWFVDGFAFFLVDRLLIPGGWIIFDDLEWTYASSPTLKDTEKVRTMPRDERETPQIRKVYELLVKPHSSYGDFMTKDGWAYARKIQTDAGASFRDVKRELVYQEKYIGLGAALLELINKISTLKMRNT